MNSQQLANVIFGLNIIAWGILGLWFADEPARWCVVRVCITLLHFVAGELFLLRGPLVRSGKPRELAMALPSLVVCGLAFRGARPIQDWNRPAEIVFVIGTGIAIVSLLSLGRSFAVFPAVREIISHGPYRIVRHPAYAGEVLLVWACAVAFPNLLTIAASICILPLVGLRILAEERVLATAASYKAYQQRVRWRLFPNVW